VNLVSPIMLPARASRSWCRFRLRDVCQVSASNVKRRSKASKEKCSLLFESQNVQAVARDEFNRGWMDGDKAPSKEQLANRSRRMYAYIWPASPCESNVLLSPALLTSHASLPSGLQAVSA
jgi:hypothetical protein